VVGPTQPGRDPVPAPSHGLTPGGGGGAGSSRPDPLMAIDAGRAPDAAGLLFPVEPGPGVPVDAGPVVEIDAGPVIEIDAALSVGEPVDAAAVEPAVDADSPEIDAAPEAVVGADVIMRELNRQLVASGGRLDRCYTNATKSLPPEEALRGQVDIGLAVLLTGAVADVTILRNTTSSDQLGQCAQAVVAGWTFSAHDGAEPIHLLRTFTFGPK
jgi:hypothetical protein